MQCTKLLLYRNAVYHRNDIWSGIISLCKYSSVSTQNTFKGQEDRYKGITVDSIKEKCSQENFVKTLEESISKWKHEGNRCIWFKVNINHTFSIPILAQRGFNFHHAREDFVMMYKWLPEDLEPNLPPSCHTNLAVGAMVFNAKKEILAVSEEHYEYPHWKLPGGYVERGEDMVDAAIREVKEETGVDTEFLSLITFRHTHNMMFNNSDIYVLLMMRALSDKIIPSVREVKDCKWMAIEDYSNHPHVHEFNRLVANKAVEYRNRKIKLDLRKERLTWPKYTRDINFLNVTDGDY